MSCVFNMLKTLRNSLIVCLMLKNSVRRKIFSGSLIFGGGTPPLRVASFFSASREASVKILKKNFAFLNLEQRERVRA